MHYKSDRKNPFFSILIPSYNRPEYITKSIESILDNDFDDYEIIISDDNSPKIDEIEKSIKKYLEFENVHFFKQRFVTIYFLYDIHYIIVTS